MKYRAIIKQSDGWWIGWLVDLPGVNAQEKTREKLIESLRIGAEDMLATPISFEPESMMIAVDVPAPAWNAQPA
jgi:predicted RNase H-like HicB family nuclease